MNDFLPNFEDPGVFNLKELEVFNWGPFAGKHRASFDTRGTAIIGATGSGKTTLIDALMTLLAENPRYNLASTGGHDKNDRSLLSYIRGHGGGPSGDIVARPGKTVTALGACYDNSGRSILLGAIFWMDGASNSQQDLKRRFVFAEDKAQTIEKLLRIWEIDGARSLMKHSRETPGLRIFESKKQYLAHLRKFFDVSENAFTLLNRAAGLKQLDSVDSIFRELVLDDKSAFDRAVEVASDFDNLSAIHKELEDARKQQESLEPIRLFSLKREKRLKEQVELDALRALTPRWFAGLLVTFLRDEQNELAAKRVSLSGKEESKKGEVQSAESETQDFYKRYLELGGGDIQQIEQSLRDKGEILKTRVQKAEPYQAVVSAFQLNSALTRATFDSNLEKLRAERPRHEKAFSGADENEAEARSRLRNARDIAIDLEKTIREVKGNADSNIAPNFLNFRRDLAEYLSLPEIDLPYVAELVEVKPEEAEWRGAIERAIGANRLRILVPHDQMREALWWVNQRDNKLHVRLQDARLDEAERDYFFDSYIYKLNFKNHPLRFALENLLAKHDYHCVPDADALRKTSHGLTKEGAISGTSGRFDKQDQKRLDEGWLTGFDNADQLRALARKLQEAQTEQKRFDDEVGRLRKIRTQAQAELEMLDGVLALEFEQIDQLSIENEIAQLRSQRERLLEPTSDASNAKRRYEESKKKTDALREELTGISKSLAVCESDLGRNEREFSEALSQAEPSLSDDEQKQAAKHLEAPDLVTRHTLDGARRSAIRKQEQERESLRETIQEIEKRLVSLMEKARQLNEGAYVDVGTDLDDIPAYLAELETVTKEALPEKQKRFLEYLNKSSDQGVTQLLAHIDQEISKIEDRLQELNHTLAKVDFRANHYLQLQPQRLGDQRIRELENARRHLRDAMLKEDEGRSHFQALQKIVQILRDAGNNRYLVGSRILLDPRYRLQFFVVERNRVTGKTSPPKTGSQSGSGGEKELMASHILTASLSYALCPAGADRPLYGTIILDEAFSKSSQSAARNIVEALRVFGLSPVFVTPNKEINLLKKHTRHLNLVHNSPTGSSIAPLSWEALEELQTKASET